MVATSSTVHRKYARTGFILGDAPTSKTPLSADELLAVLNGIVGTSMKDIIKYVYLTLDRETRRQLEPIWPVDDRNMAELIKYDRLGHRFYIDRNLMIYDFILQEPGWGHGLNEKVVVDIVRYPFPYTGGLGTILASDDHLLDQMIEGLLKIIRDKVSALENNIRSLDDASERIKGTRNRLADVRHGVERSSS